MFLVSADQWKQQTSLFARSRGETLEAIDAALVGVHDHPGSFGAVARLSEALAAWQGAAVENGGPNPTTARNGSGAVRLLINQLTAIQSSINAAAAVFTRDPVAFLRANLVDCSRELDASIAVSGIPAARLQRDYQNKIDFVLVPIGLRKYALNIARTLERYTLPAWCQGVIGARYMGFVYNVAGPEQMGTLDVEAGTSADLVLTAGMSGCSIVATQTAEGHLRFFHEPTRTATPDQWMASYPGTLLTKVTQRAGDRGLGTAVMRRSGAGWQIIIQSFAFDEARWRTFATSRDDAIQRQSADLAAFATLRSTDVHDVPRAPRRGSVVEAPTTPVATAGRRLSI